MSRNRISQIMILFGIALLVSLRAHDASLGNDKSNLALRKELLQFLDHFDAASCVERADLHDIFSFAFERLATVLSKDVREFKDSNDESSDPELIALVDCLTAIRPRNSEATLLERISSCRRGTTDEVGFLVEYPCAAALLKSGANVIPYLLTRDIREAESSDEHLRVEAELVGEFFAELCPPDMNVADMARAYLNGVKKVAPHNAKRIDRMIDLITKIYTVG